MLPNFLVIGAQKAATTTIYYYFKQHPEIFVPNRKEICFFSNDSVYNCGLEYYENCFVGWKGEKAVGEASPDYLACPAATERIKSKLPDVKLIVCLRDPVDRAYSAFLMQRNKGSEALGTSFLAAVKKDPVYVDHGKYFTHIRRILEVFSRDQLLIVLYDHLKTDPIGFFRRICSFLHVRAKDIWTISDERDNIGGVPRFVAVQRTLNIMFRCRNRLRNTPFKKLVGGRIVDEKTRILRNQIARWNRRKGTYPMMSDSEREAVSRMFAEETRKLAQLLGPDLYPGDAKWLG
jgi:hypothetical protein